MTELVGEVDVDRAGAPALFDQGTGCRPAYLFGGEPPLPESDGAFAPLHTRDGTPDPRPPLPVVEGGGAGETKVFLKEVPGSGSLAFTTCSGRPEEQETIPAPRSSSGNHDRTRAARLHPGAHPPASPRVVAPLEHLDIDRGPGVAEHRREDAVPGSRFVGLQRHFRSRP